MKPTITKINNEQNGDICSSNSAYLYEVTVPYNTKDKLYNMVDYIYNSYPNKYGKMLNKNQKKKQFTVEQLVECWTESASPEWSGRTFSMIFEEEKDAAFFVLAFGDQ